MKETSIVLFAALMFPCAAQTVITSGSVPGFTFSIQYETRVEPGGPVTVGFRNRGFGGNNTEMFVERYLTDASRKTYFGYRVHVLAPEAGYAQVSFTPLPLTSEFAKYGGVSNPEEWTYVGSNDASGASQLVRVGDTVELNLLRNPQTGQRIVERITVLQSSLTATPQDIHDFTLADLELSASEPRLLVNGAEESLESFMPAAGKILSIEVRNRGRYLVSLFPAPDRGLVEAGEVRGNALSFKVGADSIVLFSSARIAPGKGRYNLYVRYEPDPRTRRSTVTIDLPRR